MCYRSHCLLCNGGNSTLLPVWEVFQPLWKPQVSCTTDQTKKPWGALLTYIKTFTPLKIAVFLYISDQTCQVCLIILMFSALHFEVTLLWIISGNTVFRVEKSFMHILFIFYFFHFCFKRWSTFLCSECFPPKSGKDSISPVIGCHIKSTKHLRCSYSFRVHTHLFVRLAAI